MALQEELAANQLLQGLQNSNPRMYDLFNIIIKNLADTRVQTGIDVPRNLPKTTTGGRPPDITLKKRNSLIFSSR